MKKRRPPHPFTPDSEAIHPPEWEELLKDVTIERDYHEIPYDPACLAALEPVDSPYLETDDSGGGPGLAEVAHPAATVREIARRKLHGLPRRCILRILDTGAGCRQLAEELRVSEDTARRAIQKGIQIIKECLDLSTKKEFPVRKGKRPPVRAALFFLDTPAERQEFQEFLNLYPVLHISYRGGTLFREALILYKTGKTAHREE